MPELDVDGAVFRFPDDWEASKFDEWSYFRSVMSRIVDPLGRASHGCDVVALHDGDLWLIEAKDYSHPDAVPPSDLVAVVCEKVVDTLAGLHAGIRDPHPERGICERAVAAARLFVALRIDLPDAQPGRDKMRRGAAVRTMADYRQKLGKALRRVVNGKIHVVTGRERPAVVPWTVRRADGARGARRPVQ